MKSNDAFSNTEQPSRAEAVLSSALEKNRLPHGILLYGESLSALEFVCYKIAGQLLETAAEKATQHPDFFTLRPVNKMRQISAENTRELIRKIQHSPNQGTRKVAVIYDADRMHVTAANAFLKTLEEPPANTTIFLLATRPYSLLDTIRSRCLNFRLPTELDGVQDVHWHNWLAAYRDWVSVAMTKPKTKLETTERVMRIYLLIAQFDQILETLANASWYAEKSQISENIAEEELLALQTGKQKGLRSQLFTEIEVATRDAALSSTSISPEKLGQVIAELERVTGLLEVNYAENSALEAFFLKSLRTWAS